MKIAFIRFPKEFYESKLIVKGGSEIANQIIVDWLRSRGHEVNEFSPKTKERLELINIPAIGNPLVFQDLIKSIDEINQNDVVVTTNWFGSILPEIKIPLVVIFHACSSLVMESIQPDKILDKKILDKWLKYANKYDLGGPSSQQIHESVIGLEEAYYTKKASQIIAVSELTKDAIMRLYGADPNKITVIRNSYPIEWRDTKVVKDFSSKRLRVIALTRMPTDYNGFAGKGIYRIFEVFKNLKGFDKVLVASTRSGAFDNFMKDYGQDIEYIENADRAGVQEELTKSNISLQFSRCEACQMTLVESMFMENVPISFPIGVAPELIKHGENGFLINDVSEAIKYIHLLNNDRQKLEKMAKNARSTILDKLSLEKIGQEYLKVFSKSI